MPPGTPFHGLIPPFPIRVDQFGALPALTPIPALHLLSHTHTDHTVGLSAKSFASTIICSPDAKQMLLRHEAYNERALRDVHLRDEARPSRTFGHLKVPAFLSDGKFNFSASRDLLRTLPLHTPTNIELHDNLTVTLTLFDANHCPGAVMFLVEGPEGAVLHTGDFRAEPWFLDDIRRNPFLQPYLAPPEVREGAALGPRKDNCTGTPLFKTLDSIYLDTECLLSTIEVPTKSDATQGLVSLMSLFSPETTFFINAWTWGYEDIFRAIARFFRSQIHVDRYKYNIYSHLTDPFLRSLITPDASKTRFHACERFDRCTHANRDDVVYINPVTMSKSKWDQYLALTESKLRAVQPVTVLLVPLSRHSPLQELRAFVSLFRPVRVVPNCLDPSLRGLDELSVPHIFANCLSSPPSHSSSFTDALVEGDVEIGIEISEDHGDVALQNVVGDGAGSIARAWADSGRIMEKLAIMEPFLKGKKRNSVRKFLGVPPVQTNDSHENEGVISILLRMRDAQRVNACRAIEHESDPETEREDEDRHAITAKLLFGITERSQSPGRIPSPVSPPGGHPLVEKGCSEDGPVPLALRTSTPLVSERDSHQNVGKGTSRRRTDSDLASPPRWPPACVGLRDTRITRLGDADRKPLSSSCASCNAPSLPSHISPARDHSHATSRDDPPLANLQNIPCTGTKRRCFQPQSQSQTQYLSREQSPVLGSLPSSYLDTAMKRRKVERWLDIHAGEDGPAPTLVSAKEVVSYQEVAPVQAEKDAARQTDCAGECGPDVDEKARRAKRRALRARSRAIEEKLRRALPMHAE
ncbi:hypothetical protein BJV74DRAFT_85576 [Russula compacta]|nr:hypothetical protein BJV74DRAFT_85576 [Russula compacta]